MNNEFRILLLEDDPHDAELILHEVRKQHLKFVTRRVQTESEFRQQLREFRPDLILADYLLPAYDGLSALAVRQSECAETPFILVSGTVGEELAVDSLHRGATDYVLKQRMGRLGPALQRALREVDERRERRRAEEELQRRHEELVQTLELQTRLATAVEQAAEAIMITDPHGAILYVNPAFEKTTGFTREEAIGQTPRILRSGKQDAEFYRRFWETIGRGEVWAGGLVNQRKDGGLYEQRGTVSPIRDAAGRITSYVAVMRDVTPEVELEAQLRQAQKLEAIGQLAGGVAHDFNNILSTMMMQIELANLPGDLPASVRDALHELDAGAQRAANLTRQLLLFSRRQVMQPKELDLNEVVGSLAKMLRRIIGEDVRLELRLHPTPLITVADAGMLDQVLMNLAVNARDAMPGGGRLLIETAERMIGEDLARLSPEATPGRHVWLSVSDTGCGIPREILPRIFDPFFTTKPPGKGTGLGLATVFGIVKQHRGAIKVESEPGRGTNFQVFLPATDTAAAGLADHTVESIVRGGTETIFVVEDDEIVRPLMRLTLELQGYRVVEAANGIEAQRLWPRYHDEVALLFTDLIMPEGVSGWELARQFRADKPHLKVIYTSGYSADMVAQHVELRAGHNFVQKPASPHQILEIVRRMLDS